MEGWHRACCNLGMLEADVRTTKAGTTRIVISEPSEDQLESGLKSRELAPELVSFLRNLMKANRWTRKINIPSARHDLCAALVFTSTLKESGLEIFSELHVFFAGRVMVEKWQVVGETEQTSALPQEAFSSVDIPKVRLNGTCVEVAIIGIGRGGELRTDTRRFEFGSEAQDARVVRHPLQKFAPLPVPA